MFVVVVSVCIETLVGICIRPPHYRTRHYCVCAGWLVGKLLGVTRNKRAALTEGGRRIESIFVRLIPVDNRTRNNINTHRHTRT